VRFSNVAVPLILALAFAAPAASLAEPNAARATPAPATSLVPTGPQPGDPAPEFALSGIDGKTLRLADFRGKTLVLNVWATWCPPCRLEMPDLIAAAPAYAKAGGVAFLGVDTTETAPIVKAYAAAKGVPYPLAIDGDSSFSKAYDIQAFPTTYVIDPQGIVRSRYVDVLAKRQLAQLVAAGRAGRNATIVSPLQAKIDATLAAPASALATTDPTAVEAAAEVASTAIGNAEKLLDDSDAAAGNSTDFERTRAEEAALRNRTIAALASAGTSG
jgi:peroxiredoxin